MDTSQFDKQIIIFILMTADYLLLTVEGWITS